MAKNHTPMMHIPGPKPGSDRVVKMHHGMASGIEVSPPERKVETHQRDGKTGRSHVPGLTSHRGKGK